MKSRINPYGNLDLVKPLIDYAHNVEGRLEPSLAKLVEIRASQINGCAQCLATHTQESPRSRRDGRADHDARRLA